jgi:hypothetical protein
MKKKIAYLGELTWDEAMDKASGLGLIVPNHLLMVKILKVLDYFPDLASHRKLPSQFNTSTTYQWNTSKFVLPVDKDIFELQNSDSVENSSKSIKRHAYAVSPDMTETDIDMFNFNFSTL